MWDIPLCIPDLDTSRLVSCVDMHYTWKVDSSKRWNLTIVVLVNVWILKYFEFVFHNSVAGKTVSSHELSNSFERELLMHKESLLRKSKSVRFEDHLDNSAHGQLGELRRQFRREDQKARMKKEVCNLGQFLCLVFVHHVSYVILPSRCLYNILLI